jgi:hypothetical protein
MQENVQKTSRPLVRSPLVHDRSFLDSGVERDGQSWEQALWTTGGKLELPKFLYHILYDVFDPDGSPRMDLVANMGQKLSALTSGHKKRFPSICNTASASTYRTLDMLPTPDGSTPAQFEVSLAKGNALPKS